ncbi:4Fe-4S dicluster domain-containing protein [Synergistaceae bacterium OttesenSCG-928-I11]|nr:4Fe-4S dicluster domain-containing protein [Synergistaceae bacterium OttesenSCG-928-I11]
MRRPAGRRVRIIFAAFFMSLTVASFILGSERLARLMSFQPSMLSIRVATGFAVSALIAGVAFLLATFLFGRFFCAILCPLGILQDAIIALRWKRTRPAQTPNLKALRYAIAALTVVFLVGGWAVLLRYLDPFSRFGGIFGGINGFTEITGSESHDFLMLPLAGSLLFLTCLAILTLWRKRVYCVAICPVGTVLGLFSKYGVWQIRIAPSCTACGLCEGVCPTDCIDTSERAVDNERCVRCMNCTSQCTNGSISLRRAEKHEPVSGEPADPSRRIFLLKAGGLAIGVIGAGQILGTPIRDLARTSGSAEGMILPPGALDAERFLKSCTSCRMCALNCPTKVIRSSGLFEPVHLEFDRGACHHDCTLCNAICPSGALQPLSLEDKQWLKIGEASCDASKCRALKENVACYLCSKVCPKGAISMTDAPNGLEVPEVAAFHCIGCGACQSVCPMTPKAIVVTGVRQSVMGSGS